MGKRIRRNKKLTRHHIRNKCNGGKDTPRNIIYLRKEKHDCWHLLFGNKTFEQAAALLLKASKMKRRQRYVD